MLFTITATTGGLDQAQVAVLDLRTGMHKMLIPGGSDAHYVPSGHLVYGAAGALRAVGFDLARLAVVGTSVQVVQQVVTSTAGAVNVAVADDGTLVYVAGCRDCRATDAGLGGPAGPGDVHPRAAAHLRPAADFARRRPRGGPRSGRGGDIWLLDPVRGGLTPITSDLADNYPVWTKNGRGILFSSTRDGAQNLFRQAADGTGDCHAVDRESQRAARELAFARRQQLVLSENSPETDWDVVLLAAGRGR